MASVDTYWDSACDTLEFNCQLPEADEDPGYGRNENIVVFRDGESFLEFRELALTTATANLTTGEVLDADL